MNFAGVLRRRCYDQRSPSGSRTKHAVVSGEMSARRGGKDREFSHEILSLEDDSPGSVPPGTLQVVEKPAIG